MSLVHCIIALTGQHHSVHAIPSYPRFPSRSDGTQLVSSLGIIPSPRRRWTWTRSHVYGSKTGSILKHDSIQHRTIHLATGRSRCAPKSYMHQSYANGLHLPDPLERSEPPRLQSRYAKLPRLGCGCGQEGGGISPTASADQCQRFVELVWILKRDQCPENEQ